MKTKAKRVYRRTDRWYKAHQPEKLKAKKDPLNTIFHSKRPSASILDIGNQVESVEVCQRKTIDRMDAKLDAYRQLLLDILRGNQDIKITWEAK